MKDQLSPVKELNHYAKKKLAKRLYRNSSLTRLKKYQTASLLAPSPSLSNLHSHINYSYLQDKSQTINLNHITNNTLVPSVSLKKLKPLQNFKKSLEISHGKVLITRPSNFSMSQDLIQESQNKKLFKKLNSISFDNKKIIPDQLINYPQDQQQTINKPNKTAKLLQGMKNKKGDKINQDEDLTPDDFIQLVQEDQTITNQFCYLKKISHPYDLKIVQFQINIDKQNGKRSILNSCPDEYTTISKKGVTYFGKQESRFVPIDQWKKQANYFNKLMSLDFFKKFRLLKNFSNWKKYLRKSAMKSMTQKLKDQLLVTDKYLRTALIQTRSLCTTLENDVAYCRFDDCQKAMSFNQFKAHQQSFLQNQFQKRIKSTEVQIKESLLDKMSISMRQFKEQNKITSSSQGKGMPLLIGDEKNLQMPYTKQATLRTQQQKFKRFLKLVDLLIVNSKINMMEDSTDRLSYKIGQQNENYYKQVVQTKYKGQFKGKQYLECFLTLDVNTQRLFLKPTSEEISFMFDDIINRSVVRLCRNHRKIINDDEILSIIYDVNEKIPKQPDSQSLKIIMSSDDRQEKLAIRLMSEFKKSYSFIEIYSKRFATLSQIYFQNMKKYSTINQYTSNDHQIISKQLEKWKDQLAQISSMSNQHQCAVFLFNFKDFKNKVKKITQQCLIQMKERLPLIFKQSIETLKLSLNESLLHMQSKPIGVQNYIDFQEHKSQINRDVEIYSQKLAEMSCIWIIMRNQVINNAEVVIIKRQQKELNDIQMLLNQLRTKIDESNMNDKYLLTRAQQQTKSMIPKLRQGVYKLYSQISQANFTINADPNKVVNFIQQTRISFDQLINESKVISKYLTQLQMQVPNHQALKKFQGYFILFENIWGIKNQFKNFKLNLLDSSWSDVLIQQSIHTIEETNQKWEKLYKQISQLQTDEQFKLSFNDIQVLHSIKVDIKQIKPITQVVSCIKDKSLTAKEWTQIKNYFENQSKQQIVQFLENQRSKLNEIIRLNIQTQLDFLKKVVIKSKKQIEFASKAALISKFWNQGNNGQAKSLSENFEKVYWQLVNQVDQKLILTNGIIEDPQESQYKLKVQKDKTQLQFLKQLLNQWNQHNQHVRYFQPIFSNSYWKNTKQFKIFSNAQSTWKKHLKQWKDYNLKKWTHNLKALQLLKDNNTSFKDLYKFINVYLNNKRQIYPKFYFISDKQLLEILNQNKDFRSIEKFIPIVFGDLKSLQFEDQSAIAPSLIKNKNNQILNLKFARINNVQVEQLFKLLDQSCKQGVKSSLKSCLITYEKDQFDRKKWVKQNILQVLLFIDKAEFTKIIQCDYLVEEGQDLNELLAFQNSQIKELQNFIYQSNDGFQRRKLQTITLQAINSRDIIEHLRNNGINNHQQFQWQKQTRYYFNLENTWVKYLNVDMPYGYQFNCCDSHYITQNLGQQQIHHIITTLNLGYLPLIKGNNEVLKAISNQTGRKHKQIQCLNNLDTSLINNICEGSFSTGTFVQFKNSQFLQIHHLQQIANFIQQVKLMQDQRDNSLKLTTSRFVNINRQIPICLHFDNSERYLHKFQFLTKNLSFQFRQINISTPSENILINLMFELYNVPNEQFSRKIKKAIKLIKQIIGFQPISFNQLKQLLEKSNYGENHTFNLYNLIKKKVCSNIPNPQFRKLAKDVFINILLREKSECEKDSKITKKKISIDGSYDEQLLNNLNIHNICIIIGGAQSGKSSLIKECYLSKFYRKSLIASIDISILNESDLLGKYKDNIWCQGILIKQIKNLCEQSEEWIVMEGDIDEKALFLIEKIKNKSLPLANGQNINLSFNWKFIFKARTILVSYHEINKYPFIKFQKSLQIQRLVSNLLESQIEPFLYSNHAAFTFLKNLCQNNFEKVAHNIKIIGYKDQFLSVHNILRGFINVMKAILSETEENILSNKQNHKGIQKLFVWSLYWAVTSGVPISNALKFEKILFEIIKCDIERSQCLLRTRFQFDCPQGTLKKFINQQKYCQNFKELITLKPQAQAQFSFLSLLQKRSESIVLTGEVGSGKTEILNFYEKKYAKQGYSFYHINVTPDFSISMLMNCLYQKMSVKINSDKNKYLCSDNGNKAFIVIDDFNLLSNCQQVCEWIRICIENKFFYDTATLQRIELMNISFLFALNSAYQSRLNEKLIKFLKPIYINPFELNEVKDLFIEQLICKEANNENSVTNVMNSSLNLFNFVKNAEQAHLFQSDRLISTNIAIQMMRDLSHFKDPEDLLKIWSYIAQNHFVRSGITKQFRNKIIHQIENLSNMMLKNNTNAIDPLILISQKSQDLINSIAQQCPLVQMSLGWKQYFINVAFLISIDSCKILKINQNISRQIKVKILQLICNNWGLKFVDCSKYSKQQIIILSNQQSCLLYFNDLYPQFLHNLSLLFNKRVPKNISYIIDCYKKNQLKQLLNSYPSLTSKVRIYEENVDFSINYLNFQKSYYSVLQKLLEFCTNYNYNITLEQISRTGLQLEFINKIIQVPLQKKYKNIQTCLDKLSAKQKDLQIMNEELDKLKNQKQLLSKSEEQMIFKKKDISEKVLLIRRNSQTKQDIEPTEKQKLNEQISQIEAELKKVKSKINQISEKVHQLQSSIKLAQNTFKSMNYFKEQNSNEYRNATDCLKKINEVVLFYAFVYSSYMSCPINKIQTLKKLFKNYSKQSNLNCQWINQQVFGANFSITDRNLLLWKILPKPMTAYTSFYQGETFLSEVRKYYSNTKIINQSERRPSMNSQDEIQQKIITNKQKICLKLDQATTQLYYGEPNKIHSLNQNWFVVSSNFQIIEEILISKIQGIINQQLEFERQICKREINRNQNQKAKIQNRIIQKILNLQSIQEKGKENLGSIKNDLDILHLISEKIKKQKQSMSRIKQVFQKDFGKLFDDIKIQWKYIHQLKQLYPYFTFSLENFIHIFKKSIINVSSKEHEEKQVNLRTTKLLQASQRVFNFDDQIPIQQDQIIYQDKNEENQVQNYQEQNNNENNKEQEVKQEKLDIFSINLTLMELNQNILKYSLHSLKRMDSIQAYTLFALYFLLKENQVEMQEIQIFIYLIKKNKGNQYQFSLNQKIEQKIQQIFSQSINEQSNIENKDCKIKFQFQASKIKKIIIYMQLQNNQFIKQSLSYAEQTLHLNFQKCFIEQKSEWFQLHNQLVLISEKHNNCFFMQIYSQIEKNHIDEEGVKQWSIHHQNNGLIQKIQETFQKNNTHLFVLINCNNIQILNLIKAKPEMNIILLYLSQQIYQESIKTIKLKAIGNESNDLKPLIIQELYKVRLSKNNPYSYHYLPKVYRQSMRVCKLTKNPDIQKLIKTIILDRFNLYLYERTHSICYQNYKNYFYMLNFLNNYILNCQKLSVKSIIKLICEYIQTDNIKLLYRDIKKTVKNYQSSFETLGDGVQESLCGQLFQLLNQNDETIMERFSSKEGIKKIINTYLPNNAASKFSTNFFFNLENNMRKKTTQDNEKLFDKKQILKKIENVLNSLPNLQVNDKLGSTNAYNAKNQAQIFFQLITSEQKICFKIISFIQSTCKKLKIQIESGRILNKKTKQQISQLKKNNNISLSMLHNKYGIPSDLKTFDEIIKFTQKKFNYLQSFGMINPTSSVGAPKICPERFIPQFFCNPKLFMYAYLARMNINKNKELKQFVCKIFNEKQKETSSAIHQNCYSLIINNCRVNNCKYDPHKGVLQLNDKNENQSLPNIYIYFTDNQNGMGLVTSVNFGCSYVPLFDKRLNIQVQIGSRLKEQSIWKQKVCIDWQKNY